MIAHEPTSKTTIVVGASRGLGRGIATAPAQAGAPVIAVARTEPGSRVIVVSSCAALQGSPLKGGYAGAKATQRFITATDPLLATSAHPAAGAKRARRSKTRLRS